MSTSVQLRRIASPGHPNGADALAVRRRYLRQRRRFSDRGWIALWVIAGALIGWLFIVGFAGLGH
jgi:hypothetical protein